MNNEEKATSTAASIDDEIEISKEDFSKLSYRQKFAVSEYGYLLSVQDAEIVRKMLGSIAQEKDILAFCRANGKQVLNFDESMTTTDTVRDWRRIALIGLLAGIFLVFVLVTQSYFLWPIDYLIGRLIVWIPIFGLAGLFLVRLWQSTSNIQRKYIRWASKIILGLLIVLAVIWLAVVFFLTCLGIGAAGCY